MQRKIIHIDMDAFFASVEQRDHVHLRGKPIAVGGDGLRGVVAAASYEARKFGVRSAMPSSIAKRRCPHLIFVPHRFAVYREVSHQIRAIFHEYTDLVEPLSLDEAYLDVSEDKLNMRSATLIAKAIRQKIADQTQLTASAGVSFNKFLAKIASDVNKPNGMKVILPHEAAAFIDALPVEKFHGIGKVTAKRMHELGIRTGADLRNRNEIELVQRFGKVGRHFYHIVRAQDDRPVNPNRIRKSIGAERTYSVNLTVIEEMKDKLRYLCQVVFDHMEQQENFGRTLTLKAKTPDFVTHTRSKTLTTEVRQLDQMIAIILALFAENEDTLREVRLLGVTVSNLEKEQPGESIQLKLHFPDQPEL